jgi:predicted negative regulator of RcsB-dependent stress response
VEELSEKEQIDVMRQWWRENGTYVIAGAALGIALLFGWNQWRGGIVESQLEASTLFETVMVSVDAGNLEDAELAATELYENYNETVYPGHARLAMARLYMDKGRDQDASDVLQGLLDSEVQAQVKNIGRMRLARILLYQEKPQAVVDLLDGEMASAYRARYSEVLGDAYSALSRYDEAEDAYAVALADDPSAATVDLTLVQMKMNDLPEEGSLPAIDESLSVDDAEAADEASDEASIEEMMEAADAPENAQ